MGFLLLVLLILVIAYFSAGIKIIQQEEAMIIEKLGAFEKDRKSTRLNSSH